MSTVKVIQILLGKANKNRANGVNQVVDGLATHLPDIGIESEVWGISRTPYAETPIREYKLRIFEASNTPFLISNELKNALSCISTETIVHFHGVLTPCFFSISLILNKRNINYIVTPHSALSPRALQRHNLKKNIYIALFEKYFLKYANKIHALTHQEKLDIQQLTAHNSDIVIVPNGITICEQVEQKSNSIQTLVFGYIGRIEKYQKGLDLLIDGFLIYKNNGGHGILNIIGSGPDDEWLEQRINKLGHNNSVSIIGPVFGDELEKLRNQFHFQVHASRWEGIAMSMLEAIARGIPLIASKGTNMDTDIIQYNAGWGIEDESPMAISIAMKEAENQVTQGNYTKYCVSAHKLALENYSWPSISEKIKKDIYLNVG